MKAVTRWGLAVAWLTFVLSGCQRLPPEWHAQFTYTTNADRTLTITGYKGKGGSVSIPSKIIGMPVASIGTNAFLGCTSLTNITLPDGIARIGERAFEGCDPTSLMIPDSVTNIGSGAFVACRRLTSVTIGEGVSSMGAGVFAGCTNLGEVYFKGGVPNIDETCRVLPVFGCDGKPTIYHLPGTKGWGSVFSGRPTAIWNPQGQDRAFWNQVGSGEIRNFMVHDLKVGIRSDGYWPVAASVFVPVSRLEEAKQRLPDFKAIIASQLAGLAKEDFTEPGKLQRTESDILLKTRTKLSVLSVQKVFLSLDIQ